MTLTMPPATESVQDTAGEAVAVLSTSIPADLVAQDDWKKRLSRLKQRLAISAGVPLSRFYGPRVDGAFGILMYHRVVAAPKGIPAPTFNVTPERFHAQLAGLLARGYVAWPLRRVIDVSRRGKPIPRQVFVVTFDDGYENVFTRAYPVLRDLGIPATVFVSTAYLDSKSPFPFDNWVAKGETPAESWQPLTTSQCQEMHDSGLIELACHTHTHADFRGRPDELLHDLTTSMNVLRDRFGIWHPTFAFPYGTRSAGFSGPAMAAVCRKAGLQCSLTTEEDLCLSGSDPFDWGRFTADQNDTCDTLAAKLDGWYSLLRGAWRSMRGALKSPAKQKLRTPITAASLPQRKR